MAREEPRVVWPLGRRALAEREQKAMAAIDDPGVRRDRNQRLRRERIDLDGVRIVEREDRGQIAAGDRADHGVLLGRASSGPWKASSWRSRTSGTSRSW